MKRNFFPAVGTFAAAASILVACGSASDKSSTTTSASNSPSIPSQVSLNSYASQIKLGTNRLVTSLNAVPASSASGAAPSLSQAVVYAYPKATSLQLVQPAETLSASPRGIVQGYGPYGGQWTLSSGVFTNSQGNSFEVGGGYAFNPYGSASGGYVYNPSNGNSAVGGILWIPGYGLVAGVHACSPTTGQCGTALVGLSPTNSGYISCVNGTCSGASYVNTSH